jgi:hypothetical protein
MRPALAGLIYFLTVFAVAFGLGTIRTLAIAPRIGALAAVLLELPVMLAASWYFGAAIIERLAIAPRMSARLVMGGTAFALLMAAELALGVFGFGRGLSEQIALLLQTPGALGLAGQIGFALIPALQIRAR